MSPRRWGLSFALGAAVLALSASSALAAVHPNINLTFKAKHGWKVTVTAFECSTKGAGVGVSVNRHGRHYSFGHFYNGPARKSGCSGSSKLNSGKLHAFWGKLFRMKMSVKSAGAKTVIPAPGCTGTLGHQRAITAHGTLHMTIHKGVLGNIRLTHVKGMMQIFDSSKNFHCKAGNGHPVKETIGQGSFGPDFLSVTKVDKTGSTSAFLSTSHKLGKVFESIDDTFTGEPFTFNKDLTSATVGSITSFMSGSVSFTGTSQCSPGWENGMWNKGTLKVHDGLTKWSYVGSATATGTVFKSTANCGTV